MTVLTIGMLARNEAQVIGATVCSLFRQSIFDPANAAPLGIGRIDLLVVPNGCTDKTAEEAYSALAELKAPHVRASVHEKLEGGKSRAWNSLVHELSSSDTTFFVFIDADIEIDDPTVIEHLIVGLRSWPKAMVTTSEPIKRFANPDRLSLARRFSVSASAQAADPHAIAGSLYCARAEALRRIWLPLATPGEDGFLCAMIKTREFTRQPVEETVRRVPGARHYFKPDEGYTGFLKHEARLLVGTAINIFLFEHLWAQSLRSSGSAGVLIAKWNKDSPQWVDEVVAQRTRGRRWRLPKQLLFMRLQPLIGRPISDVLRRLPVAFAATLASLAPSLLANAVLKRSGAARHW